MRFLRPKRLDSGHALTKSVGEQGRRRWRRLYVVAAACLAALVPLVLFAGLWIRAELKKSQRDIEVYLANRAAALSQRVDAELEQQLAALRALSSLPDFDTEPANFRQLAERVITTMPQWSALGLVDAGSARVLSATRDDWPAASELKAIGQVRDARKPQIAAAFEGTGNDRHILLYMPVVRNDAVSSVLVTAFDPRDLQDITLDQSRHSDLLLTLADGDARLLARSLSPDASIGSQATQTYRDATQGKSVGLFQALSREGEPVSNAFTRSPLTGWVAVAAIDSKRIDQLSTRSLAATLAAGTLSLVLAVILIVFILHTVMERRVSDERLAASKALGELDARLLATTQEALGEQRKASSEREVLLREIYHRVKNNLQIVQSLLRLGSRDLSSEQREPFENAVRRVGAMARVHTLLYNSPDLASIDFKDYLEELLKELSEGFSADERSIQAVLDAHSMRVPLDTAVPLAFIAVEILTNAYRHAFPGRRSGTISVEIRQDAPHGTLRIEDNGIGVGSHDTSRRRLGLTIVRKLVQQIGGTLDEPAPGSSAFVIRFPLEAASPSAAPAA